MKKRTLSFLLACLLALTLVVPMSAAAAGTASANQDEIYTFLTKNMGLNSAAACGVLANIRMEVGSQFEPDIRQGGGTGEDGTPYGSATDSAGYGLCQWTFHTRKSELKTWCESYFGKESYRTIFGQLQFMFEEMCRGYGCFGYPSLYDFLKKGVTNDTQGAYAAAYAMCYYYESPYSYNKPFKGYPSQSDYRGDLARTTFCPQYGVKEGAVPPAEAIPEEEDILLSGDNAPGAVRKGGSFSIRGKLTSRLPLTKVTVGCYNAQGELLVGGTAEPEETTFDIHELDESVSFGRLAPGVYTYRITAANERREKVLLDRKFQVLPRSHTCDKGTLLYRESEHPHCNVYSCSICGKTWRDLDSAVSVKGCAYCAKVEVTTAAPVTVGDKTASLTGYYKNEGLLEIHETGVRYGTAEDQLFMQVSCYVTEAKPEGKLPEQKLEGLSPNTKYYYQAYVTAGDRVFCGDIKYFTTKERPQPPGPVKPGIDVHFPKVETYAPGCFTDVPANEWFAKTVAETVEMGLMKGSGNTFMPKKQVTLAEVITIAARMHSIYQTGSENFVQTPGSRWYQVYLDYAYERGIIDESLYSGRVTGVANRAQVAEIFARTLPPLALSPRNTVTSIPDVAPGAPYGPAVYQLYRAGIMAGRDDKGTFSPFTDITRAEVAAIVARLAESDNRLNFTM